MSKKFITLLIACFFVRSAPAYALRVVSLLPSNTEILESVGAGADVVGTTRYDDLLKRDPRVVSVGDFMQPSMEKVVSLHPDLIVAGLWTSSHIVPRLRAMGYTVLEIKNPRSLDDIYASIRVLAQAAGRASAAGPVIDQMRARLKQVQDRSRTLPHRLRTYIEIDRPYWTVGGHDFLSEALVIAGADNVFFDLKQQAAQVSPETIIARSPDLIISFDDKRAEIAHRQGWESIRAVQSGCIIDDLSQDDLSHPSPRLVNGVEALARRIQALEKP